MTPVGPLYKLWRAVFSGGSHTCRTLEREFIGSAVLWLRRFLELVLLTTGPTTTD